MEIDLNTIKEEQIEELSKVFKGISHPVRLKILKILWDSPKYAYEIESYFDIERSNIAKQLSILLKLGIIRVKKDGAKSLYSVRMTCIPRVIGCLIPYIEDPEYPENSLT